MLYTRRRSWSQLAARGRWGSATCPTSPSTDSTAAALSSSYSGGAGTTSPRNGDPDESLADIVVNSRS